MHTTAAKPSPKMGTDALRRDTLHYEGTKLAKVKSLTDSRHAVLAFLPLQREIRTDFFDRTFVAFATPW